MKISKGSWHFKVAALTGRIDKHDYRVSLCSYFWYVVFGCVVIAGSCVVLIFLGSIILFFLTYPIWQFLSGSDVLPAVLSFISWCAFLDYIHYCTKDEDISWNKTLFEFNKKDPSDEYVERKPNIVVEYLKAKKQKICPLLKVE